MELRADRILSEGPFSVEYASDGDTVTLHESSVFGRTALVLTPDEAERIGRYLIRAAHAVRVNTSVEESQDLVAVGQ